MEYEQWSKLAEEMAIEHIVSELAEMMVPVDEGRRRAISYRDSPEHSKPWNDFQNVRHNMGSAIIQLEKLGYQIIKNAVRGGCGRRLAEGQYWGFCGETDMGQSLPALCTECGGKLKLA